MRRALIALIGIIFSTAAGPQPLEAADKLGGHGTPTPIEVVTAFSNGFSDDHGKTSIRRWFTPETVWVNEGVSRTAGIEEAIAFLERPDRSPAIAAVHFDMLAIAADGNRVLTERLDRFVDADGKEIAAVKVMGIFEVDDGHIVAWRDYFDVNFGKKISDSKQ